MEKAQPQATLYLVYLGLIIYIPIVPDTWARGLLMLNQRLKLLFSTELMAMLATPPLTPTDTLPTLTPMVATPKLMVPDMAHTPTWDKMFTTPSIQSVHTELKLSVMARGQLMLPFCMELMAMLPPTPMDTLATPYTLPSLPLSVGASLLALLQGLPLEKAQAQATLYLVNSCLIIYIPMVPGTWARGLLMLNRRLMLLFCMELMAMLPPTPMDTLATPDTLPAGAR